MELKNYIGGEFTKSSSRRWLEVREPATGRGYARVPLSDPEDVGQAVDSARKAQPGWGGLTLLERANWLDRIADAVSYTHLRAHET